MFADKPGENSVENVSANFLCSIVYGLVLAYSFRIFGPKKVR